LKTLQTTLQTTMLAAVLYGKEQVQLERIPVPSLGPGDILVRVCAALTCGTDVKVFRRGYHARMIVPPSVFGHEFAGEVVAVGESVTRFRPGQRVVAANSAPCLQCFYCSRGKVNLCEDLLFNNGAYAEFIRIPARIVERNTYEVAAHLKYQDAALAEPLACVVKGVEDVEMKAGDTVAVIGAGPIGSMFVRLAKLRGAKEAPMFNFTRLKFMGYNLDFSIQKAMDELGYRPRVNFEEAIGETLAWYKNNYVSH